MKNDDDSAVIIGFPKEYDIGKQGKHRRMVIYVFFTL
jgi:hypothetical protein